MNQNKNERYRRIDISWHEPVDTQQAILEGRRYFYVRWDDGLMTREPMCNRGVFGKQEFTDEWPATSKPRAASRRRGEGAK